MKAGEKEEPFAAQGHMADMARTTVPRVIPPKQNQVQSSEDFWVFHSNMDGFKTHAIDIEAQLALLEREPDVVLLNETKLDEASLPPTLAGYTLICRRDRVSENKGGGIAVFAKTSKAARVTLLECMDDFERCWMMIHTDDGPYLLGCWYRPPNIGNIDGIDEIKGEIAKHRANAIGIY